MKFNNRTAWAIVAAVCALVWFSGCTTPHWYECTSQSQYYRDEARKFGLCSTDHDRQPFTHRLLID